MKRVVAGLTALAAAAGLAVLLARAPSSQAAAGEAVTDASLTWAVNDTASSGAFFGGCNFLSAGTAADHGSSAVWTQTSPGYATRAGNVTITKPDSAGSYAQPTWATRCTGPDGSTALQPSTSSKSRVEFTAGSGTIDPTTNTATISWTGSFTSAFYGGLVYWSAANPTLSVAADGTGTLTASLSGYAASMTDSTKWAPVPASTVTLATLHDVAVTTSGISVTPDYAGVAITTGAGDTPQIQSGSWGSFPQSFVDFQQQTGESSYWYTSGLDDANKVAAPIIVAYTAADPAPSTVTSTPASAAAPSTATSTPSSTAASTTQSTAAARSASPASASTAAPSAAARAASSSASTSSCVLSDGVKGGSLTWGFKKSFRSYISSGGSADPISASGGAKILAQDQAVAGNANSGTFQWPFDSSPAYTSPSSFTVQYGGKVEFRYPAHYFDITIARPKLVVSGNTGTLYADVSLAVSEPGSAATTDAHAAERLATLDLTGTSPVSDSSGITRTIRTAIADVDSFSLNGTAFYTKGQALDDATVLLSGCTGTKAATGAGDTSGSTDATSDDSAVAAAATSDDSDLIPTTRYRPGTASGSSALASTGSDVGLPVGTAVLLLLAGTGLTLVASRRRQSDRTNSPLWDKGNHS